METFILIVEIVGIISFAISASIISIHHQMDIFGVVLLSLITTFGGGILRDLICDIPLAFFTGEHALIDVVVCITTSLLVFLCAAIFKKQFIREEELIGDINNYFDALGLGLFAVYGTQIALGTKDAVLSSPAVAIFLGMITCIVGGMIRDLCLMRTPFVLRKRIYAVAAISGSATYYLLYTVGAGEIIAMLAGTIATFALRVCATVFKWNMPVAISHADYEAENAQPKENRKKMKLKIGITDVYLARYGREAGLARMRLHGYEGMDYQKLADCRAPLWQKNERNFMRELAEDAEACRAAGIEIYQAHGPWYSGYDHKTKEARAAFCEEVKRAIRGCRILGAPVLVLHPFFPFGYDAPDPAEYEKINFECCCTLAEYAKSEQITIAFENMPFWKIDFSRPSQIVAFAKKINDPYFKVCLDTGHAAVFDDEQPGTAVRTIGKEYLRALHVHDTVGRDDRHLNPYHGKIDWADFTAALSEIGFDGFLSLETSIKNTPTVIAEPAELALATAAKHLAGQI